MMQGYKEEQQQQRKKRRLDDEQQQPSLAALPPPGPPAKPKRPLSAYNLFFRSERDRYIGTARRQESKEAAEAARAYLSSSSSSPSRSSRRGAVFQHLARHVAAKWNDLPDEERSQYEERAKDEKRRYEREITQWHLKKMEHSMAMGAASAGFDRQEGEPQQQQSGPSPFEAGLGLGFTTTLMEERLQDIMIPPPAAATSSFTCNTATNTAHTGRPSLRQATSSWMLGQQSECHECRVHPNQALSPPSFLGEVEKIPANYCKATTSAAPPYCCQPPPSSLSGPSVSSGLSPFKTEGFFVDLNEKITPPPKNYCYNKGGNNGAATSALKASSLVCHPDQAYQAAGLTTDHSLLPLAAYPPPATAARRDSNSRVASLEEVPQRANSPQGIAAAMSLTSLKDLKETAARRGDGREEGDGDGAFWMDPCVQSLVGSLLRDNGIEAGDNSD